MPLRLLMQSTILIFRSPCVRVSVGRQFLRKPSPAPRLSRESCRATAFCCTILESSSSGSVDSTDIGVAESYHEGDATADVVNEHTYAVSRGEEHDAIWDTAPINLALGEVDDNRGQVYISEHTLATATAPQTMESPDAPVAAGGSSAEADCFPSAWSYGGAVAFSESLPAGVCITIKTPPTNTMTRMRTETLGKSGVSALLARRPFKPELGVYPL